MKFKTAVSLTAIALAVPALGAPTSVPDFRLPTPTPTATPQVQGPVDTEGPVPVAPRVIPTETPTPAPTATQPAAVPTASSTPTPAPTRQPVARPTAATTPSPQRTTVPTASTSPTQLAPSPSPTVTPTSAAPTATDQLQFDPTATLPTQAAPVEAQSAAGEETSTSGIALWIAALVALLIALGGIFLFWRQRQPATAGVPEIEPPSKWVSRSSDAADLPPLPGSQPTTPEPAKKEAEAVEPPLIAGIDKPTSTKSSLQIKAQALTLSRSLMNATISYRLELMNLQNQSLGEISIKVDMVTAHGQAPVSEQVANEHTELAETAFVAAIDGRGTHEVKGSFSLPVKAIRPITQRGAALYVPLLRLRVEAPEVDPIICTFVVGNKPPERGAKLQPFRLDEMAQTYRNIGLRLLD